MTLETRSVPVADSQPPLNDRLETDGLQRPIRLRLDFVDGLRAVAALFVMFCHAYFQPSDGYYASPYMNHLGLSYGPIAVDVFLVVSGFCLMLPMARRGDQFGSAKEFFLRRFRRILPPYYAALLLSVAFIFFFANEPTGTAWDHSLPLTLPAFLSHLFLIHDLPPDNYSGSINYPMWSIAVEFHLYFFMPLIVFSLRRLGSLRTLAWAIAAGLLLYEGTHHGTYRLLFVMRPWYLGLFALGAVAARESVRASGSLSSRWRALTFLLWAGIVGTIVLMGRKFFSHYTPYLDTLIGIATALLLAITFADASRRAHRLTRFLSWRPLVTIGLFSYSLYLIHAPMLHFFDMCIKTFFTVETELRFLLLLGATPLIVGLAYLFHLAFEQPFLNSKPSPPLLEVAVVALSEPGYEHNPPL